VPAQPVLRTKPTAVENELKCEWDLLLCQLDGDTNRANVTHYTLIWREADSKNTGKLMSIITCMFNNYVHVCNINNTQQVFDYIKFSALAFWNSYWKRT
jgi:hypothetical protein